MDLVMLTDLVCTALAAVLLWYVVAKYVSAERVGEVRVVAEDCGGVVAVDGGERLRKRSGKRVRFGGEEERVVVDRCGSEMETEKADVAVVEGFGNVKNVGGDGVEIESVAEEGEVERYQVEDILECVVSGLRKDIHQFDCCKSVDDVAVVAKQHMEILEVEEMCFVEENGGSGSVQGDDCGVGNENVVCSHLNEMVCSVSGRCVDVFSEEMHKMDTGDAVNCGEEMEKELQDENVVYCCINEVVCSDGGRVDELIEETDSVETQAMDVEDADCGVQEMEKELQDELADRIEECIRNIVGGDINGEDSMNEGCKDEFEETEKTEDVADGIGGVFQEEDVANEGCKNEFEETAIPKDLVDQICVVTEEENIVNEVTKNVFKETEEPNDVHIELKDSLAKEKFEFSEEDDWEGIEMSELYNDFTAAAAFVREEEKDGKLSNIGSEVKMQLYGLQKIVMEGPCREAQPMAIKMSARAKWNAWQRLGYMNPEDAMKQYITLVFGINPELGEQNSSVLVDTQSEKVDAEKLSISHPDQSKSSNESQMKKQLTHNVGGIEY